MHDEQDVLTPAEDLFERYYSEKLWAWIPAVYRDEDGLADNPDVLRGIVEILARQAATARRSMDRLWEDAFIDYCDDWTISYIGDLLETRLVHELNRRGRRVDVARTIFYRRRKGTMPVLELLTRDIAGWQGTVVESFRRLARTRHGLDPEPMLLEGPITGTPPGGWARVTSVRGGERVDGPFDEYAHTPDFRQLRGHLGRYNIPKLNVHLYRLSPFEVNFATPTNLEDGRFTFDPSGRDIPLFSPDQRPGADEWRPPLEWEFPAPISCHLLGAAFYQISAELIDDLVNRGLNPNAAEELSGYTKIVFKDEARLRLSISRLGQAAAIIALFDALLANAITPESPKSRLLPNPIQRDPTAVAVATGAAQLAEPFEHQRIVSGSLLDWGTSLLASLPDEKELVIDPERGRFWFRAEPPEPVWVPVYHYGFFGDVGAGTYDRRDTVVTENVTVFPNGGDSNPGPVALNVPASPISGIFQVDDNKTYAADGDFTGIEQLTLQAANQRRPYIRRSIAAGGEWIFAAEPKVAVPPGEPKPESNYRQLTIDGLWLGIDQLGLLPALAPCPPLAATLVLDGVFDRVTIRHCTLDPGGEHARLDPDECRPIPFVRLLIRGNIEELIVESSIVGPILEDDVAGDPGTIQKLTVRDSIIQSLEEMTLPAIRTSLGEIEMDRTTVFGAIETNRLFASNSLIQGLIQVTDNQNGCFRFSATNDDPSARLPQQYESHLFAPRVPTHYFVSRRFGDAGFAQLSHIAPEVIRRGAENRSEMGAFNHELEAIKRDDLNAKFDEFMPFGLIAQSINET